MPDLFVENCSYNPAAYGIVNGQLVHFRELCPFRIYIPSKPKKTVLKFGHV